MAWRIVRQPNGKFARFSDVVDGFTHYDMHYEEARKAFGDDKVRRAADDEINEAFWPKHLEPGGDGFDRFRDCIDTIRNVHGQDRLEGMIDEMGLTESCEKEKIEICPRTLGG